MRLSLSTKWFLWLSGAIAVFCFGQVLAMVWIEVVELMQGEGSLAEELAEIAVLLSISGCVFVLMLGALWFISRRMIRPIHSIAETASRITEGELTERIEGEFANDEVGMLVSTINSAFDRYREAIDRLDRFSGNAAHQLRTPLASIRSLGEVCLLKERGGAEYRECIENVLEIVQELTCIVDKLLMIARLQPSRVRQGFARVDLAGLVTDVVDSRSSAHQQEDVRFTPQIEEHVAIMGDATLLRHALTNILDNAVRFSPVGGKISVTLRREAEEVVLSISDTGPGLPDRVRLFLVQHDGDALRGGELPAGRLGLAIVAEIVRTHKGRIESPAAQGQGACIAIRFPCAPRA